MTRRCLLVADEGRMQWAFYRYHIVDPVYFRRDVRVTMQQIGYPEDHLRSGKQIQRTSNTDGFSL